MASKSVTGSNGHHTFTMTVTERSGSASVANNTSIVDFSIVLSPAQNGYDWVFNNSDPFTLTYTINGVSGTCTLRTYNGTSTVTVKSGSQTIAHEANGSKTISWSFSFTSQNYYYLPGSGSSGSQSLTLTTIPRYPSCTQSLSSRTETTMTIKWISDTTITKVEYSTNGGSSYSTATSNANATSGTYTISGLSAGTSYSIRTRVTSKASGLATASSSASWPTYAYPFAQSMPNFNIGNSLTIGVYNPLGRQFRITLIATDNTELTASSSYKGTSVSGWNGTSVINFLYASIWSATSGTYKVRIDSTIGSSTHPETRTGGTYYAVKANCLPTAGTLTYADTTSAMIAITGDSTKIVQGKSSVRYTVTGVASKNSATVSSVKVAVNGNTYTLSKSGNNYIGGNATINSGSNVTATVTVTDSRGYSSTTSKTVTMLAYANPTATISLSRESNYYTPTTLKVSATCSYLNGNGNSVTIKYRYAQSGGSYNSWTTINNNTSYTVQLDNTYAWNVQVQVTDTAGGTTTYTKVVQRGMPLMYWDTVRTSVGIGMFPANNNSVELGKSTMTMVYDGETNFVMHRSDNNTHGSMYMVSGTDDAMGFAFRFRKPSDTSWHYSSRICYVGMLPYNNGSQSLGTSSMQWGSIYGKNIYENGTALATKYGNHVLKLNADGGWTDNATVANTTWTTAGSFTVDTGLCLVLAYAQFQANATGVRMMLIANATDSNSRYAYMAHDYRNAYTGGNITSLKAMFVTNASSAATLYCRVYQSSGQALQCLSRFTVIRLGNAV